MCSASDCGSRLPGGGSTTTGADGRCSASSSSRRINAASKSGLQRPGFCGGSELFVGCLSRRSSTGHFQCWCTPRCSTRRPRPIAVRHTNDLVAVATPAAAEHYARSRATHVPSVTEHGHRRAARPVHLRHQPGVRGAPVRATGPRCTLIRLLCGGPVASVIGWPACCTSPGVCGHHGRCARRLRAAVRGGAEIGSAVSGLLIMEPPMGLFANAVAPGRGPWQILAAAGHNRESPERRG